MTTLPAHLQNRQTPALAQRAAEGIGSSLPPHLSIQGNQFALIDATGNAHEIETTHLDVCIVDISDVTCKMYYGDKKWTPDANDPPLCFSMNGIGPSIEAAEPQARTCAECPNNVRGSALSAMSNKPIKACRDEKKMAFLVATPVAPGLTFDMVFQFTLTPGSFTNWRAYVEKFKGQAFDISDVVTRLSFERQKSGVLVFDVRPYQQGGPAPWIDEQTARLRTAAMAERRTDAIVGRTDRPRDIGGYVSPAQNAGALGAPATPLAVSAQPAAFGQPAAVPSATPGAPSAPEPTPGRRKRRTAAEMAAANQPQAAQAPAQPQGFTPAPFRPADPAASGTQPPAAPFGMAPGQAPTGDLAAQLDNIFGPAPK